MLGPPSSPQFGTWKYWNMACLTCPTSCGGACRLSMQSKTVFTAWCAIQ